ncbi:MAG: sugar:proton symporter [Catenulispora sp.]|nr:sugar:proton symporter [Catenulispora sp.]
MAVTRPQTTTTEPVEVGPRVFFTALGALGLILGAFQPWTRHLNGTDLPWGGLSQDTIDVPDNAMRTLGAAAIALGLLAVLGLADASGVLTRTAGSAGIVGLVLFVIQVERSPIHSIEDGVWIAMAGSILCVVAGLRAERVKVPREPGDY